MRYNRRKYLAALGGLGVTSVSGCLGDDDADDADTDDADADDADTDDGVDDEEWSPPRDIIDVMGGTTPSGIPYMMPTIWMEYVQDHYPRDVSYTVTTNELHFVGLNTLWNEDPVENHANTMMTVRPGVATIEEIVRDVDYTFTEFVPLLRYFQDTRGIQMNPETMPIDGHFEMTWDEFVDLSQDRGSRGEPIRFGWTGNPMHRMLIELLWAGEPRIGEEDWSLVEADGGGEARSAMLRGDLDIYQGGFGSQFTVNNEFYYTQFCILDPERQPDLAELYGSLEPEEETEAGLLEDNPHAYLGNTSLPDDAARRVIDVILDSYVMILPPNTPDRWYDIHEQAFQDALDESNVEEQVTETFSSANHIPLLGKDEVHAEITEKYETMMSDDVRPLIEEYMG